MSAALVDRAELVAPLRERPQGLNWAQIASRILELGSAKAVRDPLVEATLFGSEDQDGRLEEALREVREWEAEGLGFWTIADSCYPARVRDIQEAPSFLFSRGRLVSEDAAVSVVGSRAERSWAPAVFAQWASAVAAIGRRCRQEAIVPLTLDLIESIDLDAIGNHASRTLATLLLRASASDPLAWPKIEAHWGRSSGVRAAIMEALLQDPFPAAAQHAIRLSQDPDCPPASANQAMKRFGGSPLV